MNEPLASLEGTRDPELVEGLPGRVKGEWGDGALFAIGEGAAIPPIKMSDKSIRIIEAATKIFAKKGFYNATIADVAKAAEVAEGTIYLYFKNKDDLLISIFEHSMDVFIQAVTEKLSGLTDPKEKLRQFVWLHLKLVEGNPHLAQVLQIELRQSSKFMKEYRGGKFAEYLRIVEGILLEGQKKGVFRNDLNMYLLRRALFGAVDEMALDWLLMKKKRYSLEECAGQLSEMFIEGIVT